MNQTGSIMSPAEGSPDRQSRKPVDALYGGIFMRVFLREAVMFFAAALFLAGIAVLVWRMAFPETAHLDRFLAVFTSEGWRNGPDWPVLAMMTLVLLLVLCAAAAALLRAERLTPSKRKLLVWLDANSQCGGFLAASTETDCSAWAGRIAPPLRPRVTMLFPTAIFLAFLAAAAFLPATLLIRTENVLAGPGRLDVNREKNELKEKLEILEQEPLVPQEEIEQAKESLDDIVENSLGSSPAKTFESIDALNGMADELATKASQSLARSAENFQRLSQAASALSDQSAEAQDRDKALEQFRQLAEQLAANDPSLAEALKQSGDNLSPSMTPEQLRSFADAMSKGAQDLKERLERLSQARSNQARQQSEQGGTGDTGFANESDYENNAESLRQWLEENAPGADELAGAACPGEGEGQGRSVVRGDGAPGSGGISRGRGDAPLNFTGETEDVGDERRDIVLNNNRIGQSAAIQEFRTKPGEETSERAKTGHLSGSGEAAEHSETRILPSHRESVRRYFNTTSNQP